MVGAQSGLFIITSISSLDLLSLGHIHFQFQFFFYQFSLTACCSPLFYKGISGRLLSSSSLSSGSFSCISFSATFFDHFSFPVCYFLDGGGVSLSDSSISCDSSLSFLLNLLCGLPASLSYWHPSCPCSLMPEKALCTTLKDSPYFSATAHISPKLLMTLSPTAITTTILW